MTKLTIEITVEITIEITRMWTTKFHLLRKTRTQAFLTKQERSSDNSTTTI